MKTEHKYISYREDRDTYIVSIKVNGKQTTKTCKSLKKAIEQRDTLLKLLKLDTSIVEKMSRHSFNEAIPLLYDAFTRYIEDEISHRVSLSTRTKYILCRDNYCQFLGKLRIDKISRETWQDVFTARQEQQNYSHGYVLDDYRRFRAMYEYYIDRGIITENPLEKPINLRHTHRIPRRAFTEEEKERFLRTAKEYDEKWYIIFSLFFATACRRGEVLALQWRDIDRLNSCIHVRHNIERGTINGKFIERLGNTKTEGSIRDIPISQEMLDMLYSLKLKSDKDESFVFKPNRNVRYPFMSLGNIQRAFTLIRKRANLSSELSTHCIRHYVASKLITSGIDVPTVQAIGGWRSPQVLLSTYAHSNLDSKRNAMKLLF